MSGLGASGTLELRSLLERHYADVVAVFQPDRGHVPGLGLAGLADPALASRLAVKAARQAEWIATAITKDLADAERAARLEGKAEAATKPKTTPLINGKWSAVIVAAIKSASAKLATKLGVIANMNTQDVAEAARGGTIRAVPPGQEQGVVVKVWQSLLDGREREAHRAAHNQDQLVENAFQVGGEDLRFPGDMSLGASLGNTINCRCWADYYLQKPDGSRVPLGVATPKLPARRMRAPGAPIGSNRPKTPTIAVTFPTGNMRATIILDDGGPATISVRDGAMTIRRGRDVIASAPVYRGPDGRNVLGAPTIAPDYRSTSIDGLMRRSVEATNRMIDEASVRP